MNRQHPIEQFWYTRSRLAWLIWPILWLFNLIFLLMVLVKRFLYRFSVFSSHSFSKPVLVVGNITLGGTGKTPFINHLVNLLIDNNIRTGIVSRGYHSKIDSYPHQVTSEDNAVDVGDEAFMQFSNLCVPVVIDPDRSRGIEYLIEKNNLDLIISDDGLQHYKMSRNIEVMLFDDVRKFGNRLILPFGPLREPVSRLKSVDFVVQNGEQKNNYSDYSVHLIPTELVCLKTGKSCSIKAFSKNIVHAVAGIGNPKRFFNTLTNVCRTQSEHVFADHYQFTEEDFYQFNNDIVVMTEKDATKCLSFAQDNWYYLKVEMIFNEKLTQHLLKRIVNVLSNYDAGKLS